MDIKESKESNKITGIIFNIEEFAIYDGPGIRTAVFFKGCPLNCIWCHNPEGILKSPELTVKSALCDHCGKCESVCKKSREACTACGRCVEECPKYLRKICGYEISAADLAAKLRKNIDFYDSNGGGVTISGGEPFYQSEFLFALLCELKNMHIHRAIETSGYTSADIFKKALDHVDLVIMDIKHANPLIHKKITGIDNKQILENLEILKNSDMPFIIRIPLIPGINDSDKNLFETAELLKRSKNLIKVEFLPYNTFTKTKYTSLNKIYDPPFDETKKPNIDICQEYFTKAGIESIIL